MNCKQIQDKLIFLIEGDLKAEESSNINLHIQNCKECKYLFNQLKASLEFLEKEKQVEVNPFFSTRVVEGLKHQTKKNTILNWLKIKQNALQVAVYSFLVAIAILSGYYLGQDKSTVDPTMLTQESEISDNQLFAESYQIEIKAEDVYLVSGEINSK